RAHRQRAIDHGGQGTPRRDRRAVDRQAVPGHSRGFGRGQIHQRFTRRPVRGDPARRLAGHARRRRRIRADPVVPATRGPDRQVPRRWWSGQGARRRNRPLNPKEDPMRRPVMLRSVFVLAAIVFGLSFAAAAVAETTPDQVVQGIADDLGDAIEGHKAELQGNRDKLIQVIDGILLPHFDIDYASILVLGRNARDATPAQRARFAKAFYNSIAHRYAEGLLNYTRGRVKVLPFKGETNDRKTIVRTQVVLDDGKLLPVDYAFRKTKQGEWKAYDVIIEGISYITNYRNQVAAEIAKSDLDSLITRLETQGEKALETMETDQKGGS